MLLSSLMISALPGQMLMIGGIYVHRFRRGASPSEMEPRQTGFHVPV